MIKALAGTGHDLDLTMAHADSPTLIEHLAANDQDTETKIFLRLIDRLVAAGAECVAVTSIAGHFCIERVIEKSPLPVINLITTVHDEIQKRGLSRVGLLGTKTVMQTGFYGGLPSVEIVVPKGEDLDNVHNDYVEMATQGDATAKHKDTFIRVGAQMCEEQGAEAVLLAGTDLFLAFNGKATNFDVIDCAEIHISVLADQAKA